MQGPATDVQSPSRGKKKIRKIFPTGLVPGHVFCINPQPSCIHPAVLIFPVLSVMAERHVKTRAFLESRLADYVYVADSKRNGFPDTLTDHRLGVPERERHANTRWGSRSSGPGNEQPDDRGAGNELRCNARPPPPSTIAKAAASQANASLDLKRFQFDVLESLTNDSVFR